MSAQTVSATPDTPAALANAGLIVNIAGPESTTLLRITGWIGIADGICAWWVGFGLVLNGMGPRPVIPLIPYPYGK